MPLNRLRGVNISEMFDEIESANEFIRAGGIGKRQGRRQRDKGMDVVLLRVDDEGEPVDSFGEKGVQRIDFGWSPADDATCMFYPSLVKAASITFDPYSLDAEGSGSISQLCGDSAPIGGGAARLRGPRR